MMATSSPACSSKSMPNRACASPYRATRPWVWTSTALMTAARPATERSTQGVSCLHPHVDAAHVGVAHHLARFALGELAAEVDYEQPVGEGQQRVHHMLDPDHRHATRLDPLQLIDE